MKRSVFPRIGCTMTIILKLVMPKIDPYSHKKKLHELDAFEGICVIVAEQFTTILPSFLFKKKKVKFSCKQQFHMESPLKWPSGP